MVTRPRLKGYAALLITFILGALVGAGAAHAYDGHRYARLFGDRHALEHRRLEALARRLDLDDHQREAIGKIMEDHVDERRALMRSVMEQCGEPLRAAQARLDTQIRAVLRPEQVARYDAISKEHREKWMPGPAR